MIRAERRAVDITALVDLPFNDPRWRPRAAHRARHGRSGGIVGVGESAPSYELERLA